MSKKENKLITFFATILLAGVVILAMVLRKDETNTNNDVIDDETETSTEIETSSSDIEVADVPETVYSGVVSFTDDEMDEIDEAFSAFMVNEKYQTTVEDGDTLVKIKFKGLGTVTFKMYDDTAPKATAWFYQLVEDGTKIAYKYSYEKTDTRRNADRARWYFVTTDRVYNREEQVDEVYPMKYCIYQTLYSSNNFYICLDEIEVTDTDLQSDVDTSYLEYLAKYGGNMALYQRCIVLGRAVENEELLDQLGYDFEIESIEVVKPNSTSKSTSYETNETKEVETSVEESSTQEVESEILSEAIVEEESLEVQ